MKNLFDTYTLVRITITKRETDKKRFLSLVVRFAFERMVLAMLGMNESPDAAEAADIQQNKAMGILAYIGLLFLVPLLAAPNSRFAKYHANQGLILFLFICAVSALLVVGQLFAIIPILGWIVGIVAGLAGLAGCVAGFVFTILGIINAANGKMIPLPLIGQFKILS